MTVTLTNKGGRVIELYVPFETMGRKIERISLAPLTLDHVLRWQKGAWQESFDMLVELTGEQALVVKQLRYPDADRVLGEFFTMLPVEIQEQIRQNQIPRKVEGEQTETQEGGGPEAAFDFNDEPDAQQAAE